MLESQRPEHEQIDELLRQHMIECGRGAAGVDRVLVACQTDQAPWAETTVDLLLSVSQMLQEVDARIGAERYAQAAFEGAPIGVVLRDELLNLITCNQAFVDFVGAESVEDLEEAIRAAKEAQKSSELDEVQAARDVLDRATMPLATVLMDTVVKEAALGKRLEDA